MHLVFSPKNTSSRIYPTYLFGQKGFKQTVYTQIKTTIKTLSIGTDRPLQTVKTQLRCHRIWHLIWVYTVCHTYPNISDTLRGSRMDYRIRPNYCTVCSGFSKLLRKLIVKYVPTY